MQVHTIALSVTRIMGSPHFARGLEEARNGVRFDWRYGGDDIDAAWNYERGRIFGHIAPLDMPLRIGDRLNPKAVHLFDTASSRRLTL